MKAKVKWTGYMSFVGESGSGHCVTMDGAPEAGGRNLAPRPMEMVLMGLGGCSGIDVLSILRNGLQRVSAYKISIEAGRADAVPAVFTRIHIRFRLRGVRLDRSKVARAVSLSMEKYCSVTRMLEKTAAITHDFEIAESAGADTARA